MLVETFGHLSKRQSEPTLVTMKQFSEADVVGDQSGDDAKVAGRLGDVSRALEFACSEIVRVWKLLIDLVQYAYRQPRGAR